MPLSVFRQIRQGFAHLNPHEVRDAGAKPVRVGLVAADHESLSRMETYLVPPHLSAQRRAESARMLIRGGGPACDIEIYDSALLVPRGAFMLDLDAPEDGLRQVIRKREDLMLPLARTFYPFRKLASNHIVRAVAKENALFALATALPDVVPGLSIPWALGEFTSDAAFLTMNQVRMAFLLAAASDRPAGYREQASEIASIVAGAFGWRAIARELIGKVPFGGGLIPKAGIAWAGTFAVGLSLERLYRLGYGFTRTERKAVYEEAYDHGKQIAGMLLEGLRRKAV
ncbi:MAG TPA: hypothetical protein VGN17_24900 [Bryobacteraceae bacterium]|jgi:hypothetical protein